MKEGEHDDREAIPVHVPEEEFQKGRQEKNPLNKTRGDFFMQLNCGVAAGLGVLLRDFNAPAISI
jgi:hypothetical protein